MIETRRLKNIVIFILTILSFVLSRKIINVYNDIARRYGNVRVKDFRKYEKLRCYFYDFSVDFDAITVSKILNIHKYLMKKNKIAEKCADL